MAKPPVQHKDGCEKDPEDVAIEEHLSKSEEGRDRTAPEGRKLIRLTIASVSQVAAAFFVNRLIRKLEQITRLPPLAGP